jgi:hypothetical protein
LSRHGDFTINVDGVSRVMSMWSGGPSGGVVPGFDGVRERSIKYAKDNAEAAFALAEELTQAKDLQHLVTLQSQYAQTQMRSFAAQTQDLIGLTTEAVQNIQTPGSHAKGKPQSSTTDERVTRPKK